MKPTQAINLAVSCIKMRIQAIAFEANLCDRLAADHPAAVNASAERARLIAAIAVLETLRVGGDPCVAPPRK